MSKAVTIAERLARETARRRAAAAEIVAELKTFAPMGGGRFLIFGSVATGRMRSDSDLDVVIDFPPEREGEALDLVEKLSREHDLPIDCHMKSQASERFLNRIARDAITLP